MSKRNPVLGVIGCENCGKDVVVRKGVHSIGYSCDWCSKTSHAPHGSGSAKSWMAKLGPHPDADHADQAPTSNRSDDPDPAQEPPRRPASVFNLDL